MIWVGSSGKTRSEPSYFLCKRGLTSVPLQSGAVSTWEQKQITGTTLAVLEGIVAYTYPDSSSSASVMPAACSSSTSMRDRFFCFSVEGCDVDAWSLWVSV